MDGNDAASTTATGGSPSTESGAGPDDIANGGEPGSATERGASEPSGVRDVADSTGSAIASEAVPGRSTTDATGERPDAASTDENRPASGQRAAGSTTDWLKETEKNMATLLEILRANGATEADLEQMKPLLSNQKFAGAIESEFTAKAEWERKAGEASGKLNEFESQRNQFEVQAKEASAKEAELRNWWETQASPAVTKLQADRVAAAERTAQLEARLKTAKEVYGFDIPEDTPTVSTGTPTPTITATPATPAAPRADLPDLSRYVTNDVLNQQADMVGQAIAQTQDLAWEHQQLFGNEKPINFTDLRAKAVAEKRPVRDIWEREMNAPARRQELQSQRDAAAQAKRDAEIAQARQEGFERGMSQSVNPMTREPVNSRFGVSFTKRDETAGKPWEASGSRSQDRLQKVVSTLAKQGAA